MTTTCAEMEPSAEYLFFPPAKKYEHNIYARNMLEITLPKIAAACITYFSIASYILYTYKKSLSTHRFPRSKNNEPPALLFFTFLWLHDCYIFGCGEIILALVHISIIPQFCLVCSILITVVSLCTYTFIPTQRIANKELVWMTSVKPPTTISVW